MEQTATVEQAEPQGSAAPASAAPTPDLGQRTTEPPARVSGRDLLRSGLEARATRSSAGTERETSAADEQPGADASPGTPEPIADGTEAAATDPDRPKLSRSQRKALKTAEQQPPTAAATAAPSTDTSATPPEPDLSDPLVRVERVEKTLTDGLARLESLIQRPSPAQADPTLDQATEAYRRRYGDDAEFNRRAEIALRGSVQGQYLGTAEADELAVWAINRQTRDDVSQEADQRYRANYTALTVDAAKAHGIEEQAVLDAPTFRAIYDAFVDRGRALEREAAAAQDAERVKEIERLKGVNQQLADDLEGYERRYPGLARGLISGGMSGSGQAARITDRARLSGRQLLRAGIANGPRKTRPGAR